MDYSDIYAYSKTKTLLFAYVLDWIFGLRQKSKPISHTSDYISIT